MIRVVLIDDEALMRSGLRMLIDGRDGIQVVGEAGDGTAGLEVIREHTPDVVLLDLRMPRLNGVEVLRQLQVDGPSTNVIVLTAFDTDEFIRDALTAGANGFLIKASAPDVLVEAIRAAAEGRSILSPGVLTRAMQPGPVEPRSNERVKLLSPREHEVAELIAQGYSNPDIAATLYVSLPTVKTHVARILEKLGVENRVQIALAVRG